MGRKDILFLIALLVVLVIGFYITLGYPPRARFFPLFVISLCGVLVLAELLKAYNASRKSGSAAGEDPQDEAPLKMNRQHRQKFAATTAWIGGFALIIWLFGFVIGLPLFVLAYVKTYEEGWLWAIILPVIMFLIVYVGFGLLLQSPLYEGRLFFLNE